jgi:UDP-N-acetylmuramoyl-tripeptide--D-alanyl-D-alanine ligase
LTLAEVAVATGGRVVGAPGVTVDSVSTDSRSIGAGALFVALRGVAFDGHRFVGDAAGRGAAAALVEDATSARGPAVVVGDTLAALQALAAWWRRRFEVPLVALTGSAGKTTTKEIAAAILGEVGPTLKTQGNLNNHIGVPLTLLRLRAEHRFAVVEMGCNHHGEIARLTEIAAPTAGLITNVGEAHLEGLGSLDGVARAKGELFAGLEADATAVVNVDDERVARLPARASRRLTYGTQPSASLRLAARRPDPGGGQRLEVALPGGRTIEAHLSLLGEHNARNAVAAAALATVAGADAAAVSAGIEACGPAPHRLEVVAGPGGLVVIDDTYNANPGSMLAALDVLVEQRRAGGRAHALVGEMLELGDGGPAQHERVGRHAARRGVDTVVAVGGAAGPVLRGVRAGGATTALAAATPEDAATLLLARAAPGDVVLVKGSRGARMERAVEALLRAAERGT